MNQNKMSLDTLQKEAVFSHFFALCRIPHNSHEEKNLSDAIWTWAKAKGMAVWQDERNNLLLRRDASPDARQKPGLIMQAHMDMVCEKAPHVVHDFQKDPLVLEVSGDLLGTGGRTTLGADDGIGVALGLAIMEHPPASHPELELLLTTDEEDTFSGAAAVDFSRIHGRQLLNLDHAREGQAIVGSAGGMGVCCQKYVQLESVQKEDRFICLSIDGMVGGHSGEDIHRGRGSAISLLGRWLEAAGKTAPFRLAQLKGGTFRLAIAREARAVIAVDKVVEPAVVETLESARNHILSEYKETNPEMRMHIEATSIDRISVISARDSKLTTAFLLLAPQGILEMEGLDHFCVRSSANLGELTFDEKKKCVKGMIELRSSATMGAEAMYGKIEALMHLVEGSCTTFSPYPAWPYRKKSSLREKVRKTYETLGQGALLVTPVHCGLECGFFAAACPDLDCVSMGPDTFDLHSPQESLSISSTLRVEHFLRELIKELAR
ncbi:beta-Ala-His dipeptidase [Acidaminococcus sp.]|uniref:beta-Ala-His dipeptidase n=1 Tax=Acidaminococcus sp. TaxID=1872103 RepID=UPI003AB2AEA8